MQSATVPPPQTDSSVRPYRWQLFALSMAMLLPSLGTSIANVALPTLAGAFGATFPQVQWVVLGYLLALTTLIVSAGRLSDVFGRTRLLLVGIAIFAVASVSCALAPSLWALVAARFLQGLGAAVMMALTTAMVRDVVPQNRTGSAIGLLGTVSAVGTALGPTLGGALIHWFDWPAVFFFLAGASVATLLVVRRSIAIDRPVERASASFDYAGSILLALSLGAYALSMTLGGGELTWFNAMMAAFAAVGFVAFAFVETRVPSPLVKLELLRDRTIGTGLVSIGLVSVIMMSTLVVGPFYLTNALGLDAVRTGLVMSIGPGVAAATGFPAGQLVDRLGSFRIMLTGIVLVASGAALMTVLPDVFGVPGYAGALATITAGYALFQAANNTAVMNSVGPDRRGVTSALLGLSRNLGLITGASAMGALFAFATKSLVFWDLAVGEAAGLKATFGAAVMLAIATLLLVVKGRQR
ncbi:MFS transporter [Devosia salina]|uniref:MFS transporter n=1 Tax=Devosia salina TaxID=2860336 RepID=A0ABX8WIV4_9HYPH|nr:MFS transporter [Devosia salina]QYO77649.1 MFS transporter [Devosia salina]